MPINENDLELERRRREAGVSQIEMANFIGVSQSQVSRYEQDPESVPAGVLRKWLQLCGDVVASKGLDIAKNPRVEIIDRTKLIEDYLSVEPTNTKVEEVKLSAVTAKQFLASLHVATRKPRVGVFGKFDSGKSTLLNVLLGNNRLPTGFQPTTSIISLIRHISEKPVWQVEDVWIMKRGFDLDKADDKEHCEGHRLSAGGYEALKQYGTHIELEKKHGIHGGAEVEEAAFAAVVYIDAPLLNCVDFLDVPGYGNDKKDAGRAEIARKLVDVLLYLSPLTGFMDEHDLLYLSALLRNLPCMPVNDQNTNSLRNVYVIATHSQTASPSVCEEALNKAAKRCFKHLDKTLVSRAKPNDPPSARDLAQRFFTFSADDAGLRNRLESDLVDLLATILPNRDLQTLGNQVLIAKKSAKGAWSKELYKCMRAMEKREQAQSEYNKIMEGEPERLKAKVAQEKRIHNLIAEFAQQSESFILQTFAEKASVSAIESMIRSRYDDKKEASRFADTYLLESLQASVDDWIKIKSNDLGKEIDNFLEDYGPKVDGHKLSASEDFDARGAFIGTLSTLGTVGALTAWAAIAAAGSNLGGYILVAKVVGWLSSIGISVGGSATVVSVVAALGGPITIALGIAALIGALTWGFFGDSWQTKLAKQINKGIAKQDVQQQFLDGIKKYWDDTRLGFDAAILGTEDSLQKLLENLHLLAFSVSKEELECACLYAEEMRDFFGGIPWRALD